MQLFGKRAEAGLYDKSRTRRFDPGRVISVLRGVVGPGREKEQYEYGVDELRRGGEINQARLSEEVREALWWTLYRGATGGWFSGYWR